MSENESRFFHYIVIFTMIAFLLGLVTIGAICILQNSDKEENLPYGRFNAPEQTVSIMGTMHGDAVDMMAKLQNDRKNYFATSGHMVGTIGDTNIDFGFTAGETKEKTAISEKYGLYYSEPFYDNEWFEYWYCSIERQFVASAGGNSDHSEVAFYPADNDEVWWRFSCFKSGKELSEKFPAIHALLNDEDLEKWVTVDVYCVYDTKHNRINKRIRFMTIETEEKDVNLQLYFE